LTTTILHVPHRDRMVATPRGMDAIVVTNIVFSPPGATIAAS
jgi:hypothetical protein